MNLTIKYFIWLVLLGTLSACSEDVAVAPINMVSLSSCSTPTNVSLPEGMVAEHALEIKNSYVWSNKKDGSGIPTAKLSGVKLATLIIGCKEGAAGGQFINSLNDDLSNGEKICNLLEAGKSIKQNFCNTGILNGFKFISNDQILSSDPSITYFRLIADNKQYKMSLELSANSKNYKAANNSFEVLSAELLRQK